MAIRFFDTFEGKLRDFDPIDPQKKEVRMYTCGPTVYDYAHIGNFRAFVFEDLLRRFLEFKGFKVKHVMNITDVDDKTIAGANRSAGAGPRACPEGDHGGLPLQRLNQFTGKYTNAFREDLATLNILPANHPAELPRATQEIPGMLELIEKLVKKGVAYASEGSVYYRISAFSGYGRLSKKKLEGNVKGARVDVDEYDKEKGADFALWKKAKEGEPSWDSPWGKGRPGWHIECSAMSMKYLGETFDIHAGGEDLVFPHHENEIAQSEAATGKKFVNYWLHCKHLLVDGKKMSKKDKNFYTLRDLLAKGYDPMAIRYALLSTHYRTPLNFTLEGLKEAGEVIKKLDDCYWLCLNKLCAKNFCNDDSKSGDFEVLDSALSNIMESLASDLNVSIAFGVISESVSEINSCLSQINGNKRLETCIDFFVFLDKLFGFQVAAIQEIQMDLIKKLELLQEFRKNKQFQEADKIRAEFKSEGWLVKDGKPGEPSTVKRKRRAWDK